MTDSQPSDLLYGHVGDPTYDTKTREWHFSRQIRLGPRLEPLGRMKHVFRGVPNPLDVENVDHLEPSKRLGKLNSDHPILAAASNPVASIIKDETRAILLANDSRSMNAPLLVYAKAVDHSQPRHTRSVPILATAAGPAGDLVRLTVLNKEQLGWEPENGFRLDTFTAKGGETAWWGTDGHPIEQIYSPINEKGDPTGFLAVRRPGGISILKPELLAHWASQGEHHLRRFHLPISSLSANEIVVVEKREAQLPFRDVTFNPWDVHQFATVDQLGSWSVWVLVLRSRSKDLWTVRPGRCGQVQQSSQQSVKAFPAEGAWATIVWAYNTKSLVVATRLSISFIVLGEEVKTADLTKLALGHSQEWIVDMKRSPCHPEDILLLTSARLVIINVRQEHEESSSQTDLYEITNPLSWAHYRNSYDTTLHLESCELRVDEGKTNAIILLCSRLDATITVFTIEHDTIQKRFTSVVDPYILPVTYENHPGHTGQLELQQLPPLTLKLERLNFHLCAGISPSEHGSPSVRKATNFFKISVLSPNNSLSEGFCIRYPPQEHQKLGEPCILKKANPPKTPLKIKEAILDLEADYTQHLDYIPVKDDYLQEFSASVTDDPRTLRFMWLVERMVRDFHGSAYLKLSHDTSYAATIDESVVNIESMTTQSMDSKQSCIQTLSELVGNRPFAKIRDESIDQIEDLLHQLTLSRSNETDGDKKNVHAGGCVALPLAQLLSDLPPEVSFSGIYQCLCKSYQLPTKFRGIRDIEDAFERLLQSVAVHIHLAAHIRDPPPRQGSAREGVHSNPTPTQDPTGGFSAPQPDSSSFTPLRSTNAVGKGIETKAAIQASHIDDETAPQSPSAERRSRSGLLDTDQWTIARSVSGEEISHPCLSSIAPLSLQPPLRGKAAVLLSVWANPATVDWTSQHHRLVTSDTELAEQKAEASASKKVKRRRLFRETIEEEPARPTSIEGALGGSQPLPTGVRGFASQVAESSSQRTDPQAAEALFVSTQPEPGRHGKRPEAIVKKKKKAGFN